MTKVTTEYQNAGPIVKELRTVPIDSFFQFPEEGTVYRVLQQTAEGYLCLGLDDLLTFVQPLETIIVPREVERIDIKVELL